MKATATTDQAHKRPSTRAEPDIP